MIDVAQSQYQMSPATTMNNNNNNNRVDNDTKQNNARAIEADKVCRNLISTDGQYSNFSSIGIQLHQNNYIGCDLIFHQLCWEVWQAFNLPSQDLRQGWNFGLPQNWPNPKTFPLSWPTVPSRIPSPVWDNWAKRLSK